MIIYVDDIDSEALALLDGPGRRGAADAATLCAAVVACKAIYIYIYIYIYMVIYAYIYIYMW